MNITVEGHNIDIDDNASCEAAFRQALSGKRAKAALACKAGEHLFDLSAPVARAAAQGELIAVTADSSEGLDLIRHSASHIMAAAVRKLFPEVKVAIGPSIDNGFYYDFDVERPFSVNDFEAIEAEMKAMIDAAVPFERMDISKADALKMFRDLNETYKVELVEGLEDGTITLYKSGGFVDLCRGPHLPDASRIKAYKLMSVAGAYWRGSEKNAMLSRIYATAFAEEKDLKAHLNRIEEAKRRDHRKLGKELGLFAFHEDVAPGMVYWLPKGMLMRTILEDFLRKEHLKRGYELVQGPQILRVEQWKLSGHYDNYRENMYFTEIEDDVRGTVDSYGIKPMNCLSHMLIYKNELRSYRDLPQRYFELGVVHRHEKSGALHGLLRVRQFTQDDAHVLCTPEQLEDEIMGVIKLSRDLMGLFGFDFRAVLSTRPEKSIGSDEFWETATHALKKAVEHAGLPCTIAEGDGAFYGPKIDIKVTDAIGREWQLSTIQCDYNLPQRFELKYIGQDGAEHQPVMVHRAILGSLERFIGVLTEHYAGAFPTWLAPVQACVLTVTDAQNEFAEKVRETLNQHGYRAQADTRNEKLGYKVREAQLAKIPYILVVGDKEVEAGMVNVRLRNGDNLGVKSLQEVADLMAADCAEPFKRGGMSYRFS